MTIELTTYILIVISALHLLYHWVIFGRLVFLKEKKSADFQPPISVVISANNEYYNLIEYLPKILEQDYPEFEVVVVNDRSDDDSEMYLKELSQKYSNLKHIEVKNSITFFKGKKFPLSIGIKSAKYQHLLLTDADCYPVSDKWIASMARNFSDQKQIVLGVGDYEKQKTLLNSIIRYDTMKNTMLFLSAAVWKKPYMGLGRNLAYKKSLFLEKKGFTTHYGVSSGDDDLFVNKAGNGKNTTLALNPESVTLSIPKTSFRNWIYQKSRHLSTSKYYKFSDKIFLLFWEIINYALLGIFILNLVLQNNIYISIALFIGVSLSRMFIDLLFAKKFAIEKILLSSLFINYALLIIYPVLKLAKIFMTKNQWT